MSKNLQGLLKIAFNEQSDIEKIAQAWSVAPMEQFYNPDMVIQQSEQKSQKATPKKENKDPNSWTRNVKPPLDPSLQYQTAITGGRVPVQNNIPTQPNEYVKAIKEEGLPVANHIASRILKNISSLPISAVDVLDSVGRGIGRPFIAWHPGARKWLDEDTAAAKKNFQWLQNKNTEFWDQWHLKNTLPKSTYETTYAPDRINPVLNGIMDTSILSGSLAGFGSGVKGLSGLSKAVKLSKPMAVTGTVGSSAPILDRIFGVTKHLPEGTKKVVNTFTPKLGWLNPFAKMAVPSITTSAGFDDLPYAIGTYAGKRELPPEVMKKAVPYLLAAGQISAKAAKKVSDSVDIPGIPKPDVWKSVPKGDLVNMLIDETVPHPINGVVERFIGTQEAMPTDRVRRQIRDAKRQINSEKTPERDFARGFLATNEQARNILKNKDKLISKVDDVYNSLPEPVRDTLSDEQKRELIADIAIGTYDYIGDGMDADAAMEAAAKIALRRLLRAGVNQGIEVYKNSRPGAPEY